MVVDSWKRTSEQKLCDQMAGSKYLKGKYVYDSIAFYAIWQFCAFFKFLIIFIANKKPKDHSRTYQ